ncbi:MAG: response regulator [Armatimonadota bacterium]|nr:response regulator [bacterium]MDW8320532.1 response regulator [Armatimonadota bacterium]
MSAPTVLIADDEVNLCKVLAARLQQSRLQCVIAHDGVQALEIICSQPIDVAVLDVRLPRKNGVQVLREIRRDYPQLPCILMTAFDDVELHEEAVRLGANAVLQKPFDLEAFTELVWREISAPVSATVPHMLLQNGEKVMVDIRRGDRSYTYTPRVIAQDDRTLEIEPPLAIVDTEMLSQGVAIVQFTRGDGVYQFRSRIELATVPRPALYLRKPVSIRRLQRRKHQRVVEEGQVGLVFSLRGEREAAPLTLTGELYDLSYSGFSVLLPQAPPVGEEASFQMTLSKANLVLMGQARVVRAGVFADRVPAVYRVGLEFTRLAPATRRALMEWMERLMQRV